MTKASHILLGILLLVFTLAAASRVAQYDTALRQRYAQAPGHGGGAYTTIR